jgi:hypothetical protein
MESSTKYDREADRLLKSIQRMIENESPGIEQALQIDLDGTARQTGALLRKRKIHSAVDLLRMVLIYVLSDWSLKMVAGWALLQEIGFLSDVAVLKRLRGCSVWLGRLIGLILERRSQGLQETTRVRLRLMDASVITRPGAKGTDWRLHLGLTLWPLSIDGIEITDAQGGETLARFAPQANEIRVADRGYAFVSSLTALLGTEGFLVIRINWQNLPLEIQTGERLDLIGWLKTLESPSEQAVWLTTPTGRFALRLIAAPLPPKAIERAQQHARRKNSKKKRTVSPNTLLAARFLLLVTTLPVADWPFPQVIWLYRLRWQIELAIKRLKSLIHIDHLRVQDPRMVQTYLLGKLLVALILDELIQYVFSRQPDWFLSLDRPLSMWRLTQDLWESLRQWILGSLNWIRFLSFLPALRRYFCDSPRARPQQLAWARAFLDYQAEFSSFHQNVGPNVSR